MKKSTNINWPESWWYLENEIALKNSIQKELDLELSEHHPLWDCNPQVLAKSESSDDILVTLNDNRYALVHLTWNGKVDSFPQEYPKTTFFFNNTDLQNHISNEL